MSAGRFDPRRKWPRDHVLGHALRRADEARADRAARRRRRAWRDLVLALLLAGGLVAAAEEIAHLLAGR